jgi:hypothetical protein
MGVGNELVRASNDRLMLTVLQYYFLQPRDRQLQHKVKVTLKYF